MSHRRRGVGIGRNTAATKRLTQQKADELKANDYQYALQCVEKLESKLSEFAIRYQDEIQNDSVFRQRFLEMCAPIGVDPLVASTTSTGSRHGKNALAKVFGHLGDDYHELAVKVAEVCLASRSRNGGIMSIKEVQHALSKRQTRFGTVQQDQQQHQQRKGLFGRNKQNNDHAKKYIPAADIQVAISKLAKLGGGFRTIQVGNSTMVVSVPTELDHDHMQVLAVASAHAIDNDNNHSNSTSLLVGITKDELHEQLPSWSSQRMDRALEMLLQQSMMWIDKYEGMTYYWFPSIWQETKQRYEQAE